MKKLFFILSIVFIFSQTFSFTASTESSSVMKTLMARFESFKQYFFQDKKVISQPIRTALPITKTIPIVFYYPKKNVGETARITLVSASDDSTTVVNTNLPSNTFQDVNSYDFSPKKQYLLVHETKIEGLTSRFSGEWLGQQLIAATNITRLVDANTRQEIASFNNKTIMYEFSPDETTLLIASPQKSWREKFGKGADIKGASPSGSNLPKAGKRQQSPTGEILRYDLFDISSKKILKTFENIQSITYIRANKLFIKYDNGMMEIITIEKNQPSSFLSGITNLFKTNIQTTSTAHDPFNIRTEYDEKQKNFTLQINNKTEQVYGSTVSYHISPKNQYILIEQLSTSTIATMRTMEKSIMGGTTPSITITKLVDLISGKEIATFENVVTHEFSQNEKRLLVLCTQPTVFLVQVASSDYLYRLYDTTKENTELMQCDTTTQSAYFSSPTELTIIDKDGKRIAYDSSTGKTLAAIQQEKQEQINEEARKQAEAVLIKKEQEMKAQKEKEAQLEDEKKQELFAKLTSKEQVALTREQLPKSEIEKRETFTSPITAVTERGLASLKQLAKEYLWPTTPEKKPEASTKITEESEKQTIEESEKQAAKITEEPAKQTTQITEEKEEEEKFYEIEDIDTWMESFANDTNNKSFIDSIIKELYFDDQDDRDSLINNYKEYKLPIKKQFASFFFAPPGGTLATITSTWTKDTHFTVIVNDRLYISDTRKPSTNAIIFTSKELDDDVKAITFNKDASYLALSYDENKRIDIFKQTNGTFSEFKQLDLKKAQPIIGLKFIETKNNTYLFCLDKSYALHIVTVTEQEKSPST